MTDHDGHGTRYLDGWADACSEMRRQLTYDTPGCVNCAIDRVQFAGIAAAAETMLDALPPVLRAARHTNALTAAQLLLDAVLDTDPAARGRVVMQARDLTADPGTTADVLTILTVLAGARYDPALVTPRAPSPEVF
jgi:hypothetical protein